jgi:hypothetical protein
MRPLCAGVLTHSRKHAQELRRRQHPAISGETGERRLMALVGIGHAAVANQGHVITAIGGILDRMVDALIGEESGDDQFNNAEIAQEVIDIG